MARSKACTMSLSSSCCGLSNPISVYLAIHGWDVTAIDMVPKALATARRKAADAGLSLRFIEGDVTRLHDLGVGNGHTLLLNFGYLHTLPPALFTRGHEIRANRRRHRGRPVGGPLLTIDRVCVLPRWGG
jgi:hypothetical protein